MNVDWEEVRAWITLGAVVLAGVIAFRQYLAAQRQRKWENGFRLIRLFWESLEPDDMERWRDLFHASSEPAGAAPCRFVWIDEQGTLHQIGFEALFTEGPHDMGATERMADSLEIISRAIIEKTADAELIYHQIGQLMDTVHDWVACVKSSEGTSLLEERYPSFYRLYRNGHIDTEKWHRRTFAHVG